MANIRLPVMSIGNSSFPFGKDQCRVVAAEADGTAIPGDAVTIDTTVTTKAIRSSDANVCGILVKPEGVAWGTAPTAGRAIEVCIFGPVVANVTAGADDVMMGKDLASHADNGTLIPAVSTADAATSSCANLMDFRASDDANLHVVMFRGKAQNGNTHA